jgi:predicted GIY-YIG superfamily endonuclease
MERRLYEHNIGHSKFTSLGTPWKLLYTEEFFNKTNDLASDTKNVFLEKKRPDF